jgi:pepsin A
MPLGAVADPVTPPTFPNDGLVGLSGIYQTAVNSSSWFQHLCDEDELDQCRFGIAYQTDLTGVQYFGYVDEERFEGPLSVGPVAPGFEWSTFVDLAYNDKVILKDQWIITDSGTTVMFGWVPLRLHSPVTN